MLTEKGILLAIHFHKKHICCFKLGDNDSAADWEYISSFKDTFGVVVHYCYHQQKTHEKAKINNVWPPKTLLTLTIVLP